VSIERSQDLDTKVNAKFSLSDSGRRDRPYDPRGLSLEPRSLFLFGKGGGASCEQGFMKRSCDFGTDDAFAWHGNVAFPRLCWRLLSFLIFTSRAADDGPSSEIIDAMARKIIIEIFLKKLR